MDLLLAAWSLKASATSMTLPSTSLLCDALHRASPDPEGRSHLQDTHAFRKLVSHLPFGRTRPSFTPCAIARLRPALIRGRIIVRSNSAKAPVRWKASLRPLSWAIALVFLRQGEHPFTAPAIKLTPSIETG